MILFINKIDLVQGTAEDARSVGQKIAASVFDELGSNKIPVIVGNAQQTSQTDPAHSANPSTSGFAELEAAHSLETLIIQEFLPIVHELVKINTSVLEKEIDYLALKSSINGTNSIQSMKHKQINRPFDVKTRPSVIDLELTSDDVERQGAAPKKLHRMWTNRANCLISRAAGTVAQLLKALTGNCRQRSCTPLEASRRHQLSHHRLLLSSSEH